MTETNESMNGSMNHPSGLAFKSGNHARESVEDSIGSLKRRKLLRLGATAIGGAAGSLAGNYWFWRFQQPLAQVTIYPASSYSGPLAELIRQGLENYPGVVSRARGGRVILKPNLVEYYEARSVNTHPAVLAAAIEAFRSIGAREVIVAEGPGHRRDMEVLLEQSGLDEVLSGQRVPFVDLNLDSIHSVPLSSNYTGLDRLFFPETILGADLTVSLPKLKTHHWTGVTLSLKNMFGAVPGVKYGWPKNVLHWRGIHRSIVDINLALRPGFAIIDGIEGMEGDGPLRGETVHSGVLILGDNLTAVDATGARVMGLYPERIGYLQLMARHGGTVTEDRIVQLGEPVAGVRKDFRVVEVFSYLKHPSPVRDIVRGL
jgi:uncharacterized protein (DUF362 family)